MKPDEKEPSLDIIYSSYKNSISLKLLLSIYWRYQFYAKIVSDFFQ